MGSQGALAAPAGLGASILGTVVASGLPVSAVTGLTLMTTKTTAVIATAALLVGVGIVPYQLHSQRRTTEALSSVERDVSTLQAKLATERERLVRERELQSAAASKKSAQPAAATAKTAPQPFSLEAFARDGRAFLKAHPEVEAALAANFKISVRHTHSEIIAAMGLTEPEIARFIHIMMNVQMRTVDSLVLRLSDELPSSGEHARQLKELLGEERYQQFRDYGATAPSCTLANELTRTLYYTPSAPTPGQLAHFRQVVQQVVEDRSLGPRHTSGWSTIPPSMWNEVLHRTKGMLSPAQREALLDLQQQALFQQAQSQALRAHATKK